MNRTRTALALVLALAACAGEDGGSRGTGISTVQGNVIAVRTAARPDPETRNWIAWLHELAPGAATAEADGGVGGILVRIEGTPFQGRTDPNGLFSVGGDYAGPVSVLFQRPEDGLRGRIAVNVPAGGTLTLNDVEIDTPREQARARRQDLGFDGLVESTDCPRNAAAFVSRFRPDDGNRYTVHLGDSALHDSRGNRLSCSDLRAGDWVRVRGIVNDDGTIGAVDAEKREDSGAGDEEVSDRDDGGHDDGEEVSPSPGEAEGDDAPEAEEVSEPD
jgi:membrane-associated protease RseP (regulator of RpoE activity)